MIYTNNKVDLSTECIRMQQRNAEPTILQRHNNIVMKCKKRSESSRRAVPSIELQNNWMKSKRPGIQDCYGAIESISWIWRTLGLFPYSIKGAMTMKKYGVTVLHAAYSFILCFMCTINFIRAAIRYHTDFKEPISIAPITIYIRTLTSLLCMIISTIGRIIRHKELSASIEYIAVQEANLKKIGCCRLNYELNVKFIRAYVWTTLMIVLCLMGYDLYATLQYYPKFSLYWLFWIIPLVAQVIDLTILVSLVGILGLHFRVLNKRIICIALRTNACSPKVIVTSNMCAKNLQNVAKAHYNICAVGKCINRIFNLVLIINVMTAFLILSTTLYYIFVEVQRDDKTNYIRIGTYVHWEFIHSIPIIIIVAVCNWTSRQSIHTGKLIHKIRVEKTDCPLFENVKTFSLQLHHQKLEFSAGGFFPLNSTLLQSMIGNITTYLVILIQFQPKLD